MCGYLAFDGFTSTFQERLFKGYQMTIYNQILYVNLFSAIFSLFGLVAGGQALPAVDFILRHPEAGISVFILSLAAVTGQLCIYYTIRQMGALVYATVMTTRQFVSIIGSAMVYRHALNPKQWYAQEHAPWYWRLPIYATVYPDIVLMKITINTHYYTYACLDNPTCTGWAWRWLWAQDTTRL